jgi:hypothetical protein
MLLPSGAAGAKHRLTPYLNEVPPVGGSSYHGTLVHMPGQSSALEVERMQTGVRIEKRLLKVLKALAELKDMSLGDRSARRHCFACFRRQGSFFPANFERD